MSCVSQSVQQFLRRYHGVGGYLGQLRLLQQKKKKHRLGGLDNKYLFHSVLEAEKPKIKMPVDSVSGKGLLPGLQIAAFLRCACGSGSLSPSLSFCPSLPPSLLPSLPPSLHLIKAIIPS